MPNFEKWKKDRKPGMLMCHVFGYNDAELEEAWQESERQATARTIDRIKNMHKEKDLHDKMNINAIKYWGGVIADRLEREG